MKKIIAFLFLIAGLNVSAQWSQVNNGITGLSAGVQLLGNSSNFIFASTPAGAQLYRSNDNGNTWSATNTPLPFQDPVCARYFAGKYFAGLNNSGDCILYTTDDGNTWSNVTGAPATTVVRGFIDHAGVIFAYTSNKGIYLSTNGGASWTQSNAGLTNLNVSDMHVINNKVVAATIGGGVYISSDTGITWLQSNNGIPSGNLNGTYVVPFGNTLVYTEQSGSVWVSNDDGSTWNAHAGNPALPGTKVIYRSETSGNIYVKSRSLQTVPVLTFYDSLHFSSDQGATWQNITGNLPTNWDNSSIQEYNGFVFHGFTINQPNLGIYRLSIPTSVNEIAANSKFSLSIYPTPSDHRFTISWDRDKSGITVKTLRIRSISGQIVYETTVTGQEIGLSRYTIGSPGMYMVELLDENESLLTVGKTILN